MAKLSFKNQFRSIFGWLNLFWELFQGRGNNRYGYQTIKYVLERFEAEFCQPRNELESAERSLIGISELFTDVSIIKTTRLGSTHDGGYFLVSPVKPGVLISGGAGRNVDFELEMAKKGCLVHIFDHTVKNLPEEHESIFHYRQALYGSEQSSKHSTTLQKIILNLGMHRSSSNYLKLDIEGSEWEVLDSLGFQLAIFEQVVVEFHDFFKLTDPEFRNRAVRVFESLNQNFVICHSNGNNWRPIVNFGSVAIPEVLEVTFVRRDLVTSGNGEKFSHYVLNNPQRLKIVDTPIRIYS